MRARHRATAVAPLLLLTLLLGSIPAIADETEPGICIRQKNGATSCYLGRDLGALRFEGDELLVTSIHGLDAYDLTAIRLIDLMPEFSDVEEEGQSWTHRTVSMHLTNYPNPFARDTRIRFELPHPAHIELGIYGVDGRLIRLLASGERTAGEHTVCWDGCSEGGHRSASGVYFCRLSSRGIIENRSLIMLP